MNGFSLSPIPKHKRDNYLAHVALLVSVLILIAVIAK